MANISKIKLPDSTEYNFKDDVSGYITPTVTDVLKIQNGSGTGSLWIGGDVNASTVTNNQRHLARIVVPSYSDVTTSATLLGFDSNGDDSMQVTNRTYDAVSFGGMKKITNSTSPMAIGFCVATERGATAANKKVYPLEMDATQARFNVRPNYNGTNLATVNDIPDAVTWTQKTSTGTNIAEITIGSTTTQVYAPNGGSSVSPYTSNPAMDGTASAGSSNDYARGDHVHPSDTSKVDTEKVSSGHTGNVTNSGSQVKLVHEYDNGNYDYYSEVKLSSNGLVSISSDDGDSNTNVAIAITPSSTTIQNVVAPTYDSDAANKKYVDDSIPTKTSDLLNDSNFMTNLVTLTYGTSTWNDFITAYNNKQIVYCHVSGRMAFMAYVNNSGVNPTEVEFQYVRSRNGHTDNYQGDQVFVYKLTNAGTWTTTTRNSYTKIDVEKGLAKTYTTGTVDSVSGQGILKLKANLLSETQLTNDAVAATEVSGRVYPVALDKSGKLAVNVPWTDSGSVSNDFCITVNEDNNSSTGYSADKTNAEISAALYAGKRVYIYDISFTETQTEVTFAPLVSSYFDDYVFETYVADGNKRIKYCFYSTDPDYEVHVIPYNPNLPDITSSDNGKILQVVNGAWAAVSLPSANGNSF